MHVSREGVECLQMCIRLRLTPPITIKMSFALKLCTLIKETLNSLNLISDLSKPEVFQRLIETCFVMQVEMNNIYDCRMWESLREVFVHQIPTPKRPTQEAPPSVRTGKEARISTREALDPALHQQYNLIYMSRCNGSVACQYTSFNIVMCGCPHVASRVLRYAYPINVLPIC